MSIPTYKISLADISKAVHLSNDYISHIFKRETGKSVMDYVNERRMLMARNMIEGGEVALTDVAEALGYAAILSEKEDRKVSISEIVPPDLKELLDSPLKF